MLSVGSFFSRTHRRDNWCYRLTLMAWLKQLTAACRFSANWSKWRSDNNNNNNN